MPHLIGIDDHNIKKTKTNFLCTKMRVKWVFPPRKFRNYSPENGKPLGIYLEYALKIPKIFLPYSFVPQVCQIMLPMGFNIFVEFVNSCRKLVTTENAKAIESPAMRSFVLHRERSPDRLMTQCTRWLLIANVHVRLSADD